MWVAVFLVLLITGVIFYALARFYMNLLDLKDKDRRSSLGFNEEQDDTGLLRGFSIAFI